MHAWSTLRSESSNSSICEPSGQRTEHSENCGSWVIFPRRMELVFFKNLRRYWVCMLTTTSTPAPPPHPTRSLQQSAGLHLVQNAPTAHSKGRHWVVLEAKIYCSMHTDLLNPEDIPHTDRKMWFKLVPARPIDGFCVHSELSISHKAHIWGIRTVSQIATVTKHLSCWCVHTQLPSNWDIVDILGSGSTLIRL